MTNHLANTRRAAYRQALDRRELAYAQLAVTQARGNAAAIDLAKAEVDRCQGRVARTRLAITDARRTKGTT